MDSHPLVVDISGISSFREFQYKHSEIYNHIPHPKTQMEALQY